MEICTFIASTIVVAGLKGLSTNVHALRVGIALVRASKDRIAVIALINIELIELELDKDGTSQPSLVVVDIE